MGRQRNKDDTEMQGSRGEIQEGGVISQEANWSKVYNKRPK